MSSTPVFQNKGLQLFSAIWATVIFAPLIYFPGSAFLTGHPWKVELVTSFILSSLLLGYFLTRQESDNGITLPPRTISLVIAPCCALILWSAVSAFWAGSVLSVLHHTLVWFGYLVFTLFALKIAADRKLYKISLISLGLVIGIICSLCIIEFVFEAEIGATFGYRYGRYAEILAALLPLSFSYVLRLNRRYLAAAVVSTLLIWFALLFSMSRGSLAAAVVGLAVFLLLRILTKKTPAEKKRLVVAAIGLVLAALLTQLPLFSNADAPKGTAIARFNLPEENDAGNSLARNVRFLFAGVGLQMFSGNYLTGVGADNFGLEFNRYRRIFSADPDNEAAAGLQQEFLPERTHNEYLQILAELGLVGGTILLWFLGGVFKLGYAEIKERRFARANILTHSAAAGMIAFLFSSLFSSFSFRLMQNGLVFFFLLAILLRNYAAERNSAARNAGFLSPPLRSVLAAFSLAACLCLTVFSALKATSQYLVYAAEGERNFETARAHYENAIRLDPANASADFSYGLRLLAENQHQQAAARLQNAVNKGFNTAVSYSYLISSQTLANEFEQAINTASEAVEIFPFSVFLRVRYAAVLKNNQRHEESQRQLDSALQINRKQAETWWLFINKGALETSLEARSNREILSLTQLDPAPGIYAVLTEREIAYPNEKTRFNF